MFQVVPYPLGRGGAYLVWSEEAWPRLSVPRQVSLALSISPTHTHSHTLTHTLSLTHTHTLLFFLSLSLSHIHTYLVWSEEAWPCSNSSFCSSAHELLLQGSRALAPAIAHIRQSGLDFQVKILGISQAAPYLLGRGGARYCTFHIK